MLKNNKTNTENRWKHWKQRIFHFWNLFFVITWWICCHCAFQKNLCQCYDVVNVTLIFTLFGYPHFVNMFLGIYCGRCIIFCIWLISINYVIQLISNCWSLIVPSCFDHFFGFASFQIMITAYHRKYQSYCAIQYKIGKKRINYEILWFCFDGNTITNECKNHPNL